MKNLIRLLGVLALYFGLILNLTPAFAQKNVVNIYSYRQPELVAPLLEEFTKQTGIKTKLLYINKGLLERVRAEGVNSPVDVILTTDISRLVELKKAGLTQSVNIAEINDNIPPQYRDSEAYWFGLTMRARVIFASKERVKQNNITYEELADVKWRSRICSRSGQHVYNIALIAAMIAHLGEEGAQKWLKGVKENLARTPTGNDRAQIKAIYYGECDIALGYTYYAALMRTNEQNPEQKLWEASVKTLFPNNNDRGVHVNISGMALAKYAPNKQNAIKFMQFLASEKGQEIYANQVYEYPLKPGVKISEIVAGFGKMNPDKLPLEIIAQNSALASKLVDRVGFDD